ncbi:MAG: DUF6093 family protein [Actinobacteria bacterium]|nr:DUF6093 family protein [Actinomycetota bacterium]
MSVLGGVLGAGRRQAQARMTERVLVGHWVEGTDPSTGDAVRVLGAEHYSGVGQIKYPSMTVSDVRTEIGQQVAVVDVVLKIPVGGGPAICKGDLVKVLSSSADPSLAGRWFRVKAWPQSGQVTAHRYPIEEVS